MFDNAHLDQKVSVENRQKQLLKLLQSLRCVAWPRRVCYLVNHGFHFAFGASSTDGGDRLEPIIDSGYQGDADQASDQQLSITLSKFLDVRSVLAQFVICQLEGVSISFDFLLGLTCQSATLRYKVSAIVTLKVALAGNPRIPRCAHISLAVS